MIRQIMLFQLQTDGTMLVMNGEGGITIARGLIFLYPNGITDALLHLKSRS